MRQEQSVDLHLEFIGHYIYMHANILFLLLSMAIENEYYTIIPVHAAVCRSDHCSVKQSVQFLLLFLGCKAAATLLLLCTLVATSVQLLPNINSFSAMHEKRAAVNATAHQRFWMQVCSRQWWERVIPREFSDGECRENFPSVH